MATENLQDSSVKELEQQIDTVAKFIKEKSAELTKLRMPKTTNMQIRNRVKAKRDELKRLINHQKEYRKTLNERKHIIQSMSIDSDDVIYDKFKGSTFTDEQLNVLAGLLNVNMTREDGWEDDILKKIDAEMNLPTSVRKSTLLDVISMFLEKYTSPVKDEN